MAELDEVIDQPSESQKRIRTLSDKLVEKDAETAKERTAREAAEKQAAEVARERDFYAGYSDVVSTNPAAKDHKDEILAKVKSGYTVEDAAFAVLGKAGKLGQPKAEEVVSPAGGSAATAIAQTGTKQISEMSRDEKLAALMEAESRGDIFV